MLEGNAMKLGHISNFIFAISFTFFSVSTALAGNYYNEKICHENFKQLKIILHKMDYDLRVINAASEQELISGQVSIEVPFNFATLEGEMDAMSQEITDAITFLGAVNNIGLTLSNSKERSEVSETFDIVFKNYDETMKIRLDDFDMSMTDVDPSATAISAEFKDSFVKARALLNECHQSKNKN